MKRWRELQRSSLASSLATILVLVLGSCATKTERRSVPPPSYAGQPYGGQPYAGQPYAGQPHTGQPQASPHSQYPGGPNARVGNGSHPYSSPFATGLLSMAAETHSPAVLGQLASASIFLPGSPGAEAVTFEVINGMAVYEGDILLGPASGVVNLYGFPRTWNAPSVYSAVGVSGTSRLWPGGIVPYEVDSTVSSTKRAFVDWAVAHVSTQTVLTMLPRTPLAQDYIVFTESGGSGCSSYLGRVGGAQTIHISACGKGSIVHEIGHAVGLFHEQARSDRDNSVAIMWSEISPGRESQFKKRSGSADIGAYDYGSIMHYPRRAFSKSGKDTIVPKDPQATIGQRDGLSALDIAAIAQLYVAAGPSVQVPGSPFPGLPTIPGLPPLPQMPPFPTLIPSQ